MKLSATILSVFFVQVVFAAIIPVGRNEQFTNLGDAVAVAKAGDTILLKKGQYKEGNIIITKSIVLLGEKGAVLDGDHKNEILTISGVGIVVKGITFQNSGYSSMNDYASIKVVDASYVLIENNKIDKAYFAIHFANSSHCIIRNNKISGLTKTEQTSGNGIHLWKCDNIIVKDNKVQGHRDGIYFEFVSNSFIENNESHHNIRYGLHFMFSNDDAYIHNTFRENGAGVAVMYSRRVSMFNNEFDLNWGANAYGLLLKEISDGSIISNKFNQNSVGILMESTNRIDVSKNSFQNNGWSLRIQASCNENTVHHNNFLANTFDVATNGTMMLNNFYNNYWDKYEGYDMNKNGVGDVAYHPVSMYSMVIENNSNALILLRSFMVSLLDKAERAIPSLTPVNMVDQFPLMNKLPI